MTITLFEKICAVFYAPFYVAHTLKTSRDKGLDVRPKTSDCSGSATSGLSSGKAGVWWSGLIERIAGYGDCVDTSLARNVIHANRPSM